MEAQNIVKGVETELSAGAFTRPKYKFDGWNTAADGTGTKYADKAKVTLSTDITLYAIWTQMPAATVTRAPAGNNLTYTGSAQELVTAGEATGGTMQYALGDNATTAPTDESLYTTSIPTATEVGFYYVWYKAVGDASHSDSTAQCVTVTITANFKPAETDPKPTNKKPLTINMVTLNAAGDNVTVKDNGVTLTGSSYTVSADTKVITVTGIGEYTGTVRIALPEGSGNIKVSTVADGVAAAMTPSLDAPTETQEKAILIEALEDNSDLPDSQKTAIKDAINSGSGAYSYNAVISLDISSKNADAVPPADKTAIENKIGSGARVGAYLDLSLSVNYRIANASDDSEVTSGSQKIDQTSVPQTITLTVPASLYAPSGVTRTFSIVRVHGTATDILTSSTSTTLSFTSNLFSTYAITYTDSGSSGGSSSGGGGGSALSTCRVDVAETSHGTVKPNRSSALPGTKITLSVTPESGYTLSAITAKDSSGKEIKLTAESGGAYSFTMPAWSVTVKAAFTKPGTENDQNCPLDKFTDTDKSAWYHDGVHWALENGVMKGVGGDRFDPDGDTSRAMVVTMLWRLEGSPAYVGQSSYADVENTDWYGPAVRWADAEGIVTGYTQDGEKVFNPNGAVTREQLAAMLYRYAQHKGQGFTGLWSFPLDYPDAAGVSEWAYEAMCWMTMNGVINGMDGALAPTANASRAQVASMLMRYCASAAK